MEMFEEVDAELIGNRVEVVHFNVVQHEIIHYDLCKTWGYVDEQRSLKILLFYLELYPQFDVSICQCLAEEGGIVANEAKAFLFFYLLEVKLLVAKHYLVASFLLVDYLKKFALFGLIAHVIPHANCAALLKGPAHFFRNFESLSPVEVNVRVELRIFRRLLVEQYLKYHNSLTLSVNKIT